jgi:hypothetical protein
VLSYPTPPLSQGSDQVLLVQIGNVVFPGDFDAPNDTDGVRVWVDAPMPNPHAQEQASAMFQFVLGVLRAWRPIAGQLEVEEPQRFAPGPVRDDAGNQWVQAGMALGHATVGGEIERMAERAREAMKKPENLRRALMLNGRARRTGADYYMIHEYAEMEFGDVKGVRDALDISVKQQRTLKQSACNLSPFDGGRHATGTGDAPMSLDEQREFTAELLRAWIDVASGATP